MILTLYSLVMRALVPLLRRRLAKRGRVEPGYLLAVEERLGHYTQAAGAGFVWIHAVSLGETRTAAVLVSRLRERLPGMRLLLTHGTATGRAEGAKLLLAGDVQVWQPWDTPAAVQRFLTHFKPHIGLLMETEVWPNLVAGCKKSGVPLVLANARMSEKSQRQAQRLAWLSRPAFAALTAVWAQTQDDAQRLMQLGATVQGVFGNLKFDARPNADQVALGRAWRRRAGRAVVLFASSREGEEAAFLKILESFKPPALMGNAREATYFVANKSHQCASTRAVIASEARQSMPVMGDHGSPRFARDDENTDVQWLIVPRHPQRFDEVAGLIEQHGFTVSRRSAWPDGPPPAVQVNPLSASDANSQSAGQSHAGPVIWLGDSLGEMALYYGLADAALLGGSFEPLGGQNLIEAAACACPVVMGPHTFNFAQAAQLAEMAGAALRAPSLQEAVAAVQQLVNDPSAQAAMVRASTGFSNAHRGAVEKTTSATLALLH